MSKTPFMPLWNGDFLADTLELDATEIGAYILLIMAQWQRKGRSLPDDDKRLQRVARCGRNWPKVWTSISRFFDADADGIYSAKCRELFQNAASKSQVNAQNGARGGVAKALKTKVATVANATNSPQRNATIPEPDIREEEREAIASPKNAKPPALSVAVREAVGVDPDNAPEGWGFEAVTECLTIWLALGLMPAEIIEAARSAASQSTTPIAGPRALDRAMSEAASEKRRPKPKADPKGSRLSEDWFLPRDWGAWAVQEGLTIPEVREQAARFADYWRGVPGAKGRKADWQATWRNWIRRVIEERSTGGRNGRTGTTGLSEGGQRPDPALANIARLAGLGEAPGDGGGGAGGAGEEAGQVRLGS